MKLVCRFYDLAHPFLRASTRPRIVFEEETSRLLRVKYRTLFQTAKNEDIEGKEGSAVSLLPLHGLALNQSHVNPPQSPFS